MKKLIPVLFLLFICITASAQKKWIIISATDNSGKADTLRYGDFVKVKMKSGHRFVGNIPDVEADYFLVGYDTVKIDQIEHISFEKRHPNKFGKGILIAGGIIVAVSAGIIAMAYAPNNPYDLGTFVTGIFSSAVGIVLTGAGAIINASEKHAKRWIGPHWQVKIV